MKNKNKINIVTLGCSKNVVDSERLLRQFDAAGFSTSHDGAENGGTVIINTCGFIGDAKEESINMILQFAEARKTGAIDRLVVTGCLSQRYMNELKLEIPEVDAWYGVNDDKKIIEENGANYRTELLSERHLSTPKHFAYLKIAEGCNRSCSFCAIPMIRGAHKSRSMESLIEEAKKLATLGVKELLLISQDLTWYGIDLYKEQKLTELVRSLSDLNLFSRIRLHYLYPHTFPTDLLDLMSQRSDICPYLDIPLQHINDRILKSMKRSSTKHEIEELLTLFRNKLPHAAIRTSFIVGYPGETEEEFNELLEFISKWKFDRVGVFTYSMEENTPAEPLGDPVSEEIKQERSQKLMELQESIAFENNQRFVNTIIQVIIDSHDNETYIARSVFDSPEVDNEVYINKEHGIFQPGDLINVRVIKAEAHELYAEPIIS